MSATNFEDVIASIKTQALAATPALPVNPTLQAALQEAMNRRMVEMRSEFEAAMKQIIADAETIQQSDLLTVRISAGEEVILYRTEAGDTQELLTWLIDNGWQPIK